MLVSCETIANSLTRNWKTRKRKEIWTKKYFNIPKTFPSFIKKTFEI